MDSSVKNDEDCKKIKKFPKSIPFILFNIFLERYSTTGTSAILLLYLYTKLNFDQSTSTALFHTNELLTFFFSIVGAIIADSYLGIYKTLCIMSFVFFTGVGIVAVAAVEMLNLPVTFLTFLGLLIAVVGSGSVRANLTTFGANQYKNPEHSDKLQLYFSLQLVILKTGSLMGRMFNPIIREDVKCFNENNCYPLAFGLPASAMLLSLIILLITKRFYVQKPPSDNIFMKICRCMIHILRNGNKVTSNCDQQLVDSTQRVMKILKLFSPIPLYWSLYMQQGSRWIFQATKMNGDLGFYKIKPDQMIGFNPLFAIILMPVCNFVLYPAMAKIGLKSLLHKIIVGGYLCCLAMAISIYIQFKIEKDVISIIWIFPQYAILAMSENFVFVSLLNFAYAEAPASMKSVMTAFVFVTIALGNLIVTVISGLKIFSSQIAEFSFFTGVLLLGMIVFIFLSKRYEQEKKRTLNDSSEFR